MQVNKWSCRLVFKL